MLNSLFLIVVLVALISFIASFFTKDFEDTSGKALVLSPAGPIVEQIAGSNDPLAIIRGQLPAELYVGDLLEVLDSASKDERVTDVVLKLDNIGGTGQTVLYDVGKALQKLKDSNKNIIAEGDYYTRSAYYLASFADEIIMNKLTIICNHRGGKVIKSSDLQLLNLLDKYVGYEYNKYSSIKQI